MVIKVINGTKFDIQKAPSSSTKKLKATYTNPESGKEKSISFGAKGYEHYKDKTGLLPISQNHYDIDRRKAYRNRHKNDNLNKPSAGMLSWHLLW